jgi:ABC-type sugar transport system ATPase subunit
VIFSAKLLVLDEPVSALSLRQTAEVFRTVERLAATGVAVLIISHNVHQVQEVADRFVVMARGETIADVSTKTASADEISAMIIHGRTNDG